MEFSTRAVRAGMDPTSGAGDVAPPLHLSTIYAYDAPGKTRAGSEIISDSSAAIEASIGMNSSKTWSSSRSAICVGGWTRGEMPAASGDG